jgi:hypothetical protein
MKMKILYLAMLWVSTGYAQAPDWQWAIKQSAGGGNNDAAESIITDAEGNIIMTGAFQSESLTLGSVKLDNVNAPNQDLFLAKMNSAGEVIWALRAGGTQADYGLSLAIDPAGNIYLGGYFKSTSISIDGIVLSNPGSPFGDPFLAKFDKDGNIIWARKSTNALSSDATTSITTDQSGNVYVTGTFISDVITFGGTTLTNSGAQSQELYIVKYSPSGEVLWAESFGGAGDEVGNAIAVDDQGNAFLAGQFTSPSIIIGSTTLTNDNAPNNDLFLAKYNPNGDVLWAFRSGGSDSDYLLSLASDGAGNMYGAGYFKSTSMTIGSTALVNEGSPFGDSFLAKFDGDGKTLWAQAVDDSESSDGATDISTDIHGGVYLTGGFLSEQISFGSITLVNVAASAQDIYLVKFDSEGNALWATSTGGDLNDVGNAIACDADGHVYLAGIFASNEISFTSTTLSNSGFSTNDLFLATIGSTVSTAEGVSGDGLLLYPNPSTESINLEWNQDVSGMTLTLSNETGQVMMRVPNFSGKSIVLPRNNFPAGVYFLSIADENEIITTRKIVLLDK